MKWLIKHSLLIPAHYSDMLKTKQPGSFAKVFRSPERHTSPPVSGLNTTSSLSRGHEDRACLYLHSLQGRRFSRLLSTV